MDETGDGRRDSYSLGELADAAEVSTRTIRYYIGEGLLPPPEGGGHASRYTGLHLNRLRRIAALKAQYLPLREIRNRLGDPPLPTIDDARSPRSSARDYLRTLRRDSPPSGPCHEEDAGVAHGMPEPMGTPMGSPMEPPMAAPMMAPPGAFLDADAPPDALAEDLAPPGQLWRRIPIGDSSELVISEDLFRRRREKVEWLVRWARKVLGS